MEEALWCNQYATLKTENIHIIQNPTEVRSVGAQVIPKCLPWLIFGIIGSSAAHSFTYFYHIICHCQSTSSEFLPTGSNELTASLFKAISAHQPGGLYSICNIWQQHIEWDWTGWWCSDFVFSCLSLCTTLNSSENDASYITRGKSLLKVKSGNLHFVHCWIVTNHIWGQC